MMIPTLALIRTRTQSSVRPIPIIGVGTLWRRFVQIVLAIVLSLVVLLGLYSFVTAPPLHLAFTPAPDAGPNSVYLPGAGFSGFWYHLGLLQSWPDLHRKEYYCYSSGCLSLVLAFLNTTVDSVYDTCHSLQEAWTDGTISRYEIVDGFLQDILTVHADEQAMDFMRSINILVTTATQGVQITKASSVEELRHLLLQTTWIPFVTGQGILSANNDYYLDGGFSRRLHPTCETNLFVPVTWKTTVYSLDPSFEREVAFDLWKMGRSHNNNNRPKNNCAVI